MNWRLLARVGGGRTAYAVGPHAAKLVEPGKSQGSAPLHTNTMSVCVWLLGVLKVFWKVEPRTTALVVGVTVLARFTKLAAFVLPLKVLLLAGSHGIPHYARGFMDPDDKLFWMIGLSIAAVAFFLLTRFLFDLAAKLSGAGSQEVMRQANQLVLMSNQSVVGRWHFASITGLCADLISFTIAFTAIALINPFVSIFVATLITGQYILAAYILGGEKRFQHQLASRIRENPGEWIRNLYSANFWLAFLAILALLLADGGNTLVAIVTFVLVRLALINLASIVNSFLRLVAKKQLIDALMFPTHRWKPEEHRVSRDFHTLFQKEAHLAKLEAIFAEFCPTPPPLTVRWQDSYQPGISTFVIAHTSDANRAYYQEQVFGQYQTHRIKNEEVLFDHIPREQLNAPSVVKSFAYGPFQCRICDYGLGVPESAGRWNTRLMELLEQIWSIKPPDQLVRVFRTSHTYFYERLVPEFVEKLWLAVNDDKEAAVLSAFEGALPGIRGALSALPLYVSNRDLVRSNTARRSDGGVYIMTWGRWSLQPIGAYLPTTLDHAKLSAKLARLHQCRPDIQQELSPCHLRLAAACRQLTDQIATEQYEAAMRGLPAILHNSTLSGACMARRLCNNELKSSQAA